MKNKKLNKRRVKGAKTFKLWHRRLGVLSAFFVLLLSITGIALNHTDELSLSHQAIHNSWILNHYGIKAPTDLRFYQNSNVMITDNFVWLDNNLLVETPTKIIAAGKLHSYITIVMEDQIYLYDQQGILVDHLDGNVGLPHDIQKVNFADKALILKTPQRYWKSDEQLLNWFELSLNEEPKWASSSEMSNQQIEKFQGYFRSRFLTLERIFLDIHSGRIFGMVGVLVMDTVAVLLILLSLSGLYMWLRSIKAKR